MPAIEHLEIDGHIGVRQGFVKRLCLGNGRAVIMPSVQKQDLRPDTTNVMQGGASLEGFTVKPGLQFYRLPDAYWSVVEKRF